ncbi:MAG: phosphate acyltransferase PlsX [Acidimicrobiia bacterium]|nr:phosphate acyltransferase PlsX [Acidimicrobiia bacterium]
MTRIALDAMGGDLAPQETVRGAVDAAASGVDVVLVGDEARLRPLLQECEADLPVVHAPEEIGMGDDVASAIRDKRRSSMSVAARLVAEGEAAGMVSAGSTGAAVAAGAILIGRLPGVSRPALAAVFPVGHPTVVLDIGANLEVRPENLVQFAVMGRVLAQIYLGLADPGVGLLNVGEEEGKGRPLEKEAHALLAAAPVRFAGNVEGRDLGRGKADVFVTDGFTGNVLLKVAEGMAAAMGRLLLAALGEDDPALAVLPRLEGIRERFDPDAHGGAHLVGTRGTVVVAHGSSSRRGVAGALRLAAEGADQHLVDRIAAGLGRG